MIAYLEARDCRRGEPRPIGPRRHRESWRRRRYGDFLPAVSLGAGLTATAIACGGEHSCALLSNAQIKCWGECHVPPFPSRWPGSTPEGAGPACVLAAVI